MVRMRHFLCGLSVIALTAAAAPAATTTAATTTAAAAKGETQYCAVFMTGKKVGYSKHTRSVADGKVTTTETVVITISRAGTPLTVRQDETHIETAAGKPLGFKAVQDLSIMAMKTEGTVDDAGKVSVTVTVGQNVRKQTMDWPEGALMNEAARLLEIKKGLKEGTSYTAKVFSASSLQALEVAIRVGTTRNVDLLGRVVPLTEVTTKIITPAGAITVTSYTNRDFQTQKTIMPMLGMQVELVACNRQFALSKSDVTDFFDRLLLSPPAPLKGVPSARSITYTLSPTPTGQAGKTKLRIPATDNQTVSPGADGGVIVTVRPAQAPAGATFPYKGADKTALAALKATRFLQCDDKKIKVLARKAVGETKDTAEAVRQIEAFVRKYIEKKTLSVGYASAVEVADSRQGDCSEHALLAAAMCRAVGIPARVVTGLVYVESFAGKKNVFGLHAWTQALVGSKWIGLDAALGAYDAGHITMTVGDGNPNDFFGIVSTLGYFKITKVTVQK